MRTAVALALLLGAVARAEDGYEFILDDNKVYPSIVSLEGTPEHPRPGDLAKIDHVWITLGEPGTYRFRSDGGGSSLPRRTARRRSSRRR